MSRPFKVRRFLKPAGWLFGQIARLRRYLYERGWFRIFHPELPVICVGNIAVGGTGKTPHASHIVHLLSSQGRIAMLSRGYGRKTTGFILANTTSNEELTPALIGDEPLLLHLRFPELPLAVAEDRELGIKRLCAYAPDITAIVMDDAYQHLSVSPTLRIILTEYTRPYFLDYPMPAGRLREFPDAVHAADLVVVTKVNVPKEEIDRHAWRSRLGLKPDQPLFFTRYNYASAEPVTEAAKQFDLQPGREVVALTGIANPEPLLEHLSGKQNLVKALRFPDHHVYTEHDLSRHVMPLFADPDTPRALFTTEKDWMRLQSQQIKKTVSLLPVFIVPVEVAFIFENEQTEFTHILESHVRETQKT